MLKIKRLAACAAVSVLVGAGSVVAATEAASAASTYITVCNSSISWTHIYVNPNGGQVAENRCTQPLYNGSNAVRVDTDPTGASHSYWTTYDNLPHGACHENSDNHSSDPANYAKVTYRNFDHGNCTN